MKNKNEIVSAIAEDEWMMKVLQAAGTLDLPDWWLCAGFVRTKIWDVLHHYKDRTPLGDIDVIYYDHENRDELMEKEYEHHLKRIMPGLPWSVKNQARMHEVNSLPPYRSSEDAIAQFPETATALGVKLKPDGALKLTAPHGLKDLLEMRVCPTPSFRREERLQQIYRKRLASKQWTQKWPNVEIITVSEPL